MPSTKPRIEADLRALGLAEGDTVALHASFKSLGGVEGGPATVVDAFLAVIGESGTLMAPTFSYNCVGRPGVTPFTADTPGIHTGVVSETIRLHPSARRSAHPTHSVAAIGARAEALTAAGRADRAPLGKGCPFDLLARWRGKIVLLGVTHTANSSLHVAESHAEVGYLDIPFREFWGHEALVAGNNGEVRRVPLVKEFPGCSRNFDAVSMPLREAGIEQRGMVARADCLVLDARRMMQAVVEMLHDKPDFLLCRDITCEPCSLRRKRLEQRGAQT